MRIAPVLAIGLSFGCAMALPSIAEDAVQNDSGFIVDTSILFSPDAREHIVSLRGPYGLPSFQQGFVDNIHYRIDPDGGAFFARDARLRKGVIEVECDGRASSCVARKGIIRLAVTAEGAVNISLETGFESEDIYVGYGDFSMEHIDDSWKKLNLSLNMISVEYLTDYSQLALTRNGKLVEQISLDGLDVVALYLKWIANGQTVQKDEVLPDGLPGKDTLEAVGVNAPHGLASNRETIFGAGENGEIYSPLIQFATMESSLAKGNKPLPETMIKLTKLDLSTLKHIAGPGIDIASLNDNQISNLRVQLTATASGNVLPIESVPQITNARPVLLAAQSGPVIWDGLRRSQNAPKIPDIGGKICKPAILSAMSENRAIGTVKARHEVGVVGDNALKFSDPSEALKGLPGIYVFTDYLAEPKHLKGKFSNRVHDEIEARLKAGGIKVLTRDELKNVPGRPRMEVYFSKANIKTGCSFAVWVSVRQSILLGRNKKVRLLSGTWGSGGSHLRQFKDAPEFNTIMNHVDRFVADFKKANS